MNFLSLGVSIHLLLTTVHERVFDVNKGWHFILCRCMLSHMREAPPTLDEVVGRNLRRLREAAGLTADEVASAIRLRGLPWSRSVITTVENGRKTLDLGEFVILASYFGSDELLAGSGSVLVTSEREGSLGAVRSVLAGQSQEARPSRPSRLPALPPGLTDALADLNRRRIESEQNDAEQKAARKLGETAERVATFAFNLWGHSLTDERERRARDRANPDAPPRTLQAVRGRVTRELVAELEPVLAANRPLSPELTRLVQDTLTAHVLAEDDLEIKGRV